MGTLILTSLLEDLEHLGYVKLPFFQEASQRCFPQVSVLRSAGQLDELQAVLLKPFKEPVKRGSLVDRTKRHWMVCAA